MVQYICAWYEVLGKCDMHCAELQMMQPNNFITATGLAAYSVFFVLPTYLLL